MSTVIRPELSSKNRYWLERHRYYELKHFCLQYPIWRRVYHQLDGMEAKPIGRMIYSMSDTHSDPTARHAIARAFLSKRMEMVSRNAEQADPELSRYILLGVTKGWSYGALKARLEIPCGKDTYYDRYRRFFWLLSSDRQ